MKGISFLLIFGCLAIAAQATYLRVINAVPPGDMRMDVYWTDSTSGLKIRLFQDLNYTDIPPYFFVPILQNREQVQLSFLLKPSTENISEELVSQEDLQNLPSHFVSLRKNLTYTLIVTSTQQNQSQEGNQESQGSQGSQGNQTQNMNLQYLLLNDVSQGDEAPEGLKFVRLINLAEDASPISLIDENGLCEEMNMNNTQGNQTQGSEDQSQDQGSEDQGSQDQSQGPLAQQVQFLEATDYLELPQNTLPTSLFVCHQGQKIEVMPAALYNEDASKFSILLFTGSSQQLNQSQEQMGSGSEGQDEGSQDQGDQGSQDQSGDQMGDQSQSQSQYIAYAVSDEPLTTENVRIRIVHAESSLPAVNVYLDGQQLFNGVTFGNVTEYSLTVRGIHILSASPASQNQSDNQSGNETQSDNESDSQSGSQSSNQTDNQGQVRISTFFAWTKSYSVAIVKTSSGNITFESQDQSEDQGQQDQGIQGNQDQEATLGQPSQSLMFPGFQGDFHKIFVDQISQNATLGKDFAYVQFIHLDSNIGALNVKIGDQNISNIRFLQSSQYRSVLSASSKEIPIEVVLASSGSPIFSLRTQLQPGTLYTLWALQDRSGSPLIFLTTDRMVQIQCMVLDKD